MSVLIKGFKMPTHCIDCVLEEDGYCFLINDVVEPLDRPRSCPLVEAPTPHGRLVDADELKQQFINKLVGIGLTSGKAEEFAKTAFSATFKIIDATPTIDAEPVKHGHWIKLFEDEDSIQARCSACGMVYFLGKGRDPNYCGNCGAKMDLDEVEE